MYVVSVASVGVYGIILGGWASNNKYSLMGGLRSAAQMVSYEVPFGLSIVGVLMMTGSLDLVKIVDYQAVNAWNFIPQLVACFIFFVSMNAENNRTPFDLPEAESELVAGYHTEYSAMKFAFFMLAEYASMFVVACVATTLFLGGWSQVLPGKPWIPGPVLFTLKALVLVFVQMWLRWSLPRLRVDQLMHMCWKVMLPISLVLVLGVGLMQVI